MTLQEFATERITPTADQLKAFQVIDTFFRSDKRCFLLKGYAGTGKTTITKIIADYVNFLKQVPVLLAPTGRAAQILNEKTGHPSSTIHRGIYNLKFLDEVEIKSNEKRQFKFRFNLLTEKPNITQIYLIDEASMISDKRSEQDFFVFGSGVLLQDILHFVAPKNKARQDKIIFIGDPAQLPPVSDPVSGALSKQYLKEKYDLECDEFELTQVVRQAEESGILATANYLRNRLDSDKITSQFAIGSAYPDVEILNSEVIAAQYKKLNPNLELNHTAVINFSNKNALHYNLKVRQEFFSNSTQIQAGDLLMINQNNYNYDVPLYNGTMVKVLHVDPIPIQKRNIRSYDQTGKECNVTLKFRSIRIETEIEDGRIQLSCLILEDFLYSELPQLKYEEHIALYIDFKIRHPHLKPKTDDFREAIQSDPYFNALRVKYGYAITCHKAQGGEWESAIVNLDLSLGRQSDAFNRWLYTAVTRAQKMLYLFNYKATTPFSKLNPNFSFLTNDAASNTETKTISFRLPDEMDAILDAFKLSREDYFKQEKFKEILARAHYFNHQITARETHAFQEKYTFQKSNQQAVLVFWYNGKQQFTRITSLNTPNQNQEYKQQLLADFTKPATIVFEDGMESYSTKSFDELEQFKAIYFPDNHQKLSILYDSLQALLEDKHISIETIHHKDYHEIYSFTRGKEKAKIQFYYNDLFEFTTALNIIVQCNSNALLKDLQEIIYQITEKN